MRAHRLDLYLAPSLLLTSPVFSMLYIPMFELCQFLQAMD